MNNHKKAITIVLIASLLLLAGCAEKKKYYKVKNYTPRVSTMGFSIEPPRGKGWYESHKDKSLIYLKKTDPYKYSLQTKATEINFPGSIQLKDDFIKYVHNKKIQSLLGTNYKNAKLDYSIERRNAALCVKYNYKYEDHGYINLKKNEYVIIKNNGLVCIHPQIPTNGIELSYLEKSISSSFQQSYINEGEKFLDSLAFVSGTN